MTQFYSTLALDTSRLQLFSKETNEQLSNAKVTVLDVENLKSYYLNTDNAGYNINDSENVSVLDNKLLVLSAVYKLCL